MTYSPGGPGAYQPPQQPSYGAPSTGSFAKPAPADPGESRLPFYLKVTTVVLGLLAYVVWLIGVDPSLWLVLLPLVASLVGVVGLLPKGKDVSAPVAVLSTVGLLVIVQQAINNSGDYAAGWALWTLLALAVLQAAAAGLSLLYSTGVLTPPVPQPKQPEYPQYGGYGAPGGYYGHQQGGPTEQRPGYPSQYGGYSVPAAPPSGAPYGGPGAPGQQPPSGPHSTPTPPTGFPSFSPPPAVSSGQTSDPGQTGQPGPSGHQGQAGPAGQPPTA